MEILLVAPEAHPIVKIGGIADGIAGLAKALHGFGHDVTVAIPWFTLLEPEDVVLARRSASAAPDRGWSHLRGGSGPARPDDGRCRFL
jgi:hypothetical protein